MAEIFNFSTFRKENERSYRSLSYKILLTEGSINSCAFLRKLQKILKLSHSTKIGTIFESFQSNLPKTTFICFSDFISYFFSVFKKNRPSISSLSVILSFIKFCVARTFLVDLHLNQMIFSRFSRWLDQNYFTKRVEDSLKKENELQKFKNLRFGNLKMVVTDITNVISNLY